MPRAFFEDDAFFEPDAFFETLVAPAPPLLLLGEPGAPIHALAYRALGGSVADLDLLYGVLGKEASREDVQPIFAWSSRTGTIRCYGREIPRQAILDIVTEAHATLLNVEDVRIEGGSDGANLFGYIGLLTRPISSVTLSNADGSWDNIVANELLLGMPAGLYVDIAHQVVMPVQVGTISGYEVGDGEIIINYGHVARRETPTVSD